MSSNKSFYPLDFIASQKDGAIHMTVYGLDEGFAQKTLVDKTYQNYLFLLLTNISRVEEITKTLEQNDIQTVTSIHTCTKTFFGDSYTTLKVYLPVTSIPYEFIDYCQKIVGVTDVLEGDLSIVRKYIREKQLKPFTKHTIVQEQEQTFTLKATNILLSFDQIRLCSFDIETYAPSKRIDTKNPIISIAYTLGDEKKVITWSKHTSSLSYVHQVKSEKEMIAYFFAQLQKQKPHIICGYNSDAFDFSYIADRCVELGIKPKFTPSGDGLQFSSGSTPVAICRGMPHIDLFPFIRLNLKNQLRTMSYSLDAVSQELLGDEKHDIDITQLYKAWDEQDAKALDDYFAYNVHDCVLCTKLFEVLLPNMLEFSKLIPLPLQELTRMSYSQLVEWYLIFRAVEFDELVPNKPRGELLQKRLQEPKNEGAFVFKPTPGLYKKIAVFDFQSLYPSIIASCNIEKSTINRDSHPSHQVPELEQKIYVDPKRKSFIPKVIADIIKRRVEIKEKLKNTSQETEKRFLKAQIYNLKILANSMYGYLAFAYARWHSNESAAATTAFARHYIKYTIKKAQEEGFHILYGDTDSIFLELRQKTKKDAEDFVKRLNTSLPGIMELQLENYFQSGIFVGSKSGRGGAKKRYALYEGNDSFKITGLEYVRTDWCDFARNTQYEVIKILLAQDDVQGAVLYVKKQIQKLKNHEVSISDLTLQAKLSRSLSEYTTNLPHVVLAKQLQQEGQFVGKGSRIRYVVRKGSGAVYERVAKPEDVKIEDLDGEYYIQNQLLPVVLSLLEVFGMKKDDILSSQTQGNLSSYFG
ncbi:MAG: DNA polymerase domain-containing protein [Candidatus Woesearchaeota archaeon]